LLGITEQLEDVRSNGQAIDDDVGCGDLEAMLVGLVEGEALLEVDAGQRKLSQIIQDRLQRGVDPHEARRVLLVLGQGEALLLELPRRLEIPSVLVKGRQTS